jgi:beta-xylosidase
MKIPILSLVPMAFVLLFNGCALKPFASHTTASGVAQSAGEKRFVPANPPARLSGDYPDPSVIRVGGTYWAVATTSAWAPAFSIFSSPDLTHWQLTSAVFPKPPAWSDGNYWAPELVHMDSTYFVYYSAKDKKTQSMCVAVATAKSPNGPYQDHGTLVCDAVGSIDAAPVVDESGHKFLFWKEDGNSQKKPTPIHVQPLSDDGTQLTGTRSDTITNDVPWEKQLVEAPYVFKRKNYWYMLYAGSGCCGRQCDYAVGVARAKTLLGPWEKNPANPILASNARWKCPGHGSVVTTADGKDVFVYHAYDATDFNDVGRQVLADSLDWNSATEWPTINNGLGPALNLSHVLKPIDTTEIVTIQDDFSSNTLHAGWQWPHNHAPSYQLNPSKKQISLSAEGTTPTSAVLAKSTSHGKYVATAIMDLATQDKETLAGLAAVGNEKNALGLGIQNRELILWQLKDGQQSELARTPKLSFAPVTKKSPRRLLHLRLSAHQGHLFQFSYSQDGINYTPIGPELDGSFLPPWDLGIRVALTAASGTGVFKDFKMESTVQ